MLKYYLELLGINEMPNFLVKYLECPSLKRLKKVGYFCGMDYASKDIYNFQEYISRYDHSLSVALLTYKLTSDIKSTLAGLFHDIGTPCFSHVIDYMNKDYEEQESTEIFTEKIIRNDKYLLNCLEEDNILIEEIVDFKKYSIVDNKRPKACADRIDGVILTGIGWTKNINKKDILDIVKDMYVCTNEYNEKEIAFNTKEVAEKVIDISKSIDIYCHFKEDNYMMELLANITKIAIENKYISYEDLFVLNEEEIFNIYDSIEILKEKLNLFKTIKKEDVLEISIENVKIRDLNLIVNGKRIV